MQSSLINLFRANLFASATRIGIGVGGLRVGIPPRDVPSRAEAWPWSLMTTRRLQRPTHYPPELGQVAPQGIARLRPLPDQQLADQKNHRCPLVSALFTATRRIVGLCAALQIASALASSFFWNLTKGFT